METFNEPQVIVSVQNRIYEIRGERVLLDFDLAALYETETRIFNQAVKRNIKRFPKDFMFQLTKEEWNNLRFQFETSSLQIIDNEENVNNRSQIVTTSRQHGGSRYLPYAFTEQGVAMLSGVLNSDKAINMNIAIMRAFVETRKILLQQNDLKEQLKELKERVGNHDTQLNQIYDALENLLDETKFHSTKKIAA
ncbi:DNA-binding protein [Arachidicoccus ginsenosidimutans]|uniref:ORF6N domain-containing protein n=1 Tax=Arachidicoccus sp. BS20 TaxID=1850526 RepID=UPI0007F124BD|nr:ORF6N domain-containing protein [Arachidicoccus sp. BS20]ANI88646.1 DNA-binding protein [Arachidicoccus sp. BS20]